jgi:hypothetical protein
MHFCMMLWTISFYLLLLILCSYIIIFQTSICISLIRMQMFRPFSQKTTLPSGVRANLSNPELYGLFNTSVLRIPSESGYLGAWYMQPGASHGACPVTVLYLHGRSQNRGYSHRVGLYKVLLNMGFCVLSMDYRGFGDSSGVEIQEDTVLGDANNAHRYLKRYYKPQKILIWGHSLGAPIAARLAAQDINKEDDILQYLVLESSFDNMEHLVETGGLPGWQKLGIHMVGLERADLAFRSVYIESIVFCIFWVLSGKVRAICIE